MICTGLGCKGVVICCSLLRQRRAVTKYRCGARGVHTSRVHACVGGHRCAWLEKKPYRLDGGSSMPTTVQTVHGNFCMSAYSVMIHGWNPAVASLWSTCLPVCLSHDSCGPAHALHAPLPVCLWQLHHSHGSKMHDERYGYSTGGLP